MLKLPPCMDYSDLVTENVNICRYRRVEQGCLHCTSTCYILLAKWIVLERRMSSQTTATNRGCAWSDDEVKALLAVWGEGNIQEELDGAVRNKTVFVNISKKVSELGHDRDWQQCRVQMHEVKDHNGETGRGRKTCKCSVESPRTGSPIQTCTRLIYHAFRITSLNRDCEFRLVFRPSL